METVLVRMGAALRLGRGLELELRLGAAGGAFGKHSAAASRKRVSTVW